MDSVRASPRYEQRQPAGPSPSDHNGGGAPQDTALVVPVLAETLVVTNRRQRCVVSASPNDCTVEESVRQRAGPGGGDGGNRLSISQIVEIAPPIRYEGETMVIPVVEECWLSRID